MPTISEYLLLRFGIKVALYSFDTGQHNLPHVHATYQGEEVVVAIPSGDVIEGVIAATALKKVRAWIELNEEALMERWEAALTGRTITKID